ncbi:hypothetical protein M0805_005186 [Coniferiporia weirii]|nr:hypothetical protein M0805_005186 [Coniferiporia weirii]
MSGRYSVSSHESAPAIRLVQTEPLRVSRVPRADLSETFGEFVGKYSKVRSKLSQLQKTLRMTTDGGSASKAAAKLIVHFEGVESYLKQYVDALARADLGPPPEVPEFNLSSALSSLASSSRALSRSLTSVSDLIVDDVEPLDTLAQLAESDAKVIKDNKAFNRSSGIRVRQHTADLLLRFCKVCDEVAACISGIMKAGEFLCSYAAPSFAMTCITILFSIVTAVMLSSATSQDGSSLGLALSGFWIVSLAFGVASAITSALGLMWWESASYEERYTPGSVMTWFVKGSMLLFVTSALLFSGGLCIFAFSSSQAVPTRIIVIVLATLHFLGLLVSLTWLIREHYKVKGRAKNAWSSVKRLTQVSIRASMLPPDKIVLKDVEQGFRSTTPAANSPTPAGVRPVIRVTDTDPPLSSNAAPDAPPSEPDLTRSSLARMSLVVPAAHRVSSDSSRSLPPLPRDVQVVRCMRYSPNGMFLCIGNSSPQERCTIFSADSPSIILGEMHLMDVAQQIEWSPNGEHILLRLSHVTCIWNAMPSNTARRPTFIIHQEADVVKWLPHGDAFLSCRGDVLTNFDLDGNPIAIFQLPTVRIKDFVVTQDGRHVVCLVTVDTSARSGLSTKTATKLIVYDLDNKAVSQMCPIGSDACSLLRSIAVPEVILVNFIGSTPPQLWQYVPTANAAEKRNSALALSFRRVMSFNLKTPSSGRFSGKSIFGGTEDKLVLSIGEDGDMFVFAQESGQLLRYINGPRASAWASSRPVSGTEPQRRPPATAPVAQCVAWDPDILSFCACVGFADGSIWQWKMAFDDMSQNRTSFAVMALDDEDLTMIRARDGDGDGGESGGGGSGDVQGRSGEQE